MRIKSVKATNFLSYKDLNYTYSNQGLTLLEGHDEDLGVSTGAGKSAFLDVVSYAFFGQISKDISADEIINRQTKKDLSVILEFEDEGRTLSIHRYRRHSDHGNDVYLEVDNQIIRGKDVRETQKIIEQTIGFSFDVFSKATYFSQFSSVDRFLSASDTEKKNLISEICDLGYYDEVLEKVREDLQIRGAQMEDVAKKIQMEESKAAFILEKQKSAQKQRNDWQSVHDQNLANAERAHQNFDVNKEAKLFQLDQQLMQLTAEFNLTLEKIATLSQKKPAPCQSQKAEVEEKLDIIKQLEQKRMALTVQINHKEVEHDKLVDSIASENAKMAQGNSSTCYHCYQTIDASQIQKKIDTLRKEAEEKIVAIKQLKLSVVAIEQGIQIKDQVLAKQKEIQTAELQARRDSLELEGHQRNKASIESRIKMVLDDIEKTKKMENPYTASIAQIKQEKNPYALMDHTEDFLAVQKTISSLKEDLTSKKEVFDHAYWWKEGLSIYIRSYLMDSFLDQINIKSNEYLKTLFDGILQINIAATTERGKEIKEKISITIINGNEECTYESLSGGERCRICLAVNLAISDLTCQMSRKNFNILMMDEIFTGLDEHGKNQTMKLLKELEHRFDTVFVIDHTEGFKSMFTNVITVSKRGGVSEVQKVV